MPALYSSQLRPNKVWSLEPLVTPICHVVTPGIHQYIQASPLTLSAVGQKRTSFCISLFYGKKKKNPISPRKCQQQGKYSLGFHLLHRKLTNVKPSITSCWPFLKVREPETLVSPPKRGWKRVEMERITVCHLQCITFTKWSSHHATLARWNQGQTLNLNEISFDCRPIPLPPSDTHAQRYRFWFYFFLMAELESMAGSMQKAESHKASPQKTCECSEVESKSICSCTRPSVPQIHPFHRHYHLHPACSYDWVTGFYITHYN